LPRKTPSLSALSKKKSLVNQRFTRDFSFGAMQRLDTVRPLLDIVA
jgi:hypothetical protein